jgi:hypothetical protein
LDIEVGLYVRSGPEVFLAGFDHTSELIALIEGDASS